MAVVVIEVNSKINCFIYIKIPYSIYLYLLIILSELKYNSLKLIKKPISLN